MIDVTTNQLALLSRSGLAQRRTWRAVLVMAVLPALLGACANREAQELTMAPLVPVASTALPPARSSAWSNQVSGKPVAP